MPSSARRGKTRHKIILGIDYGTTFSGVSYVTTEKTALDDINIITSWPGEQASSSKTPTRIAYARENPRIKTNKWGFQVDRKSTSYSWTKLLLDQNDEVGEHDDPTLAKMAGNGILRLPSFRDATGVCEDFLRELYAYVSSKLAQEMTAATFDNTPMECWITLPAIWSDEAKDATLAAAKQAGFANRAGDEIFTITEPEAAAIATLKRFAAPNALNPIKPEEKLLICDCGGGTVDITTYVITQVSPYLSFDELHIGTGAKCGSTFIDRNLHLLLSKWFGSSFDDLPFSQKGPGSSLMTSFETYKKAFGSSNDRDAIEIGPIKLDLPDSEHYDEDERLVLLTHEDMQALFDPVIADITGLLSQQAKLALTDKNATIDRVVLVGGFSESPYLYKTLKEWCWLNGNAVLMRPPNPQAAIVRGAALRGLDGLAPRVKDARRHYGTAISMPFRDKIDPEDKSWLDAMTDVKMCGGRMTWLISKGAKVVEGTFETLSLSREYTPGEEEAFQCGLYSCSLEDVPEHVTHDHLEYIGCIKVRFPANFNYGRSTISQFNPGLGRQVHQFSFEIQVVFGSKGSNLTFKVVVNGKVISKADIEFHRN